MIENNLRNISIAVSVYVSFKKVTESSYLYIAQ